MEEKESKLPVIIIVIGLIVLLAGGAYFLLINEDTRLINKKEKTEEKNPVVEKEKENNTNELVPKDNQCALRTTESGVVFDTFVDFKTNNSGIVTDVTMSMVFSDENAAKTVYSQLSKETGQQYTLDGKTINTVVIENNTVGTVEDFYTQFKVQGFTCGK